MKIDRKLNLDASQIKSLSSVYIDHGVKKEAWELQHVHIDGPLLQATARMTATSLSPTDPSGFHLSMFVTQEILAQVANIYLHVAAGLETKCRESWMRECRFIYRNVIRSTENIQVEMTTNNLRWVGDTLLGVSECRMFDDQGGLFEARLKGLLR